LDGPSIVRRHHIDSIAAMGKSEAHLKFKVSLMRKFLAVAAMLLSSVAMADNRLSISDIRVVKVDGSQVVQGYARNETSAAFGTTTLIFKVYDGAGNMVGNAVASGMGLGPGESWKFTATSGLDFKTAEVTAVQIN
jgi:hypothetical protein